MFGDEDRFSQGRVTTSLPSLSGAPTTQHVSHTHHVNRASGAQGTEHLRRRGARSLRLPGHPTCMARVPTTLHQEGTPNSLASLTLSGESPLTFQFSSFQQFLPQTDDLIHTSCYFILGIVVDVNQLLPRFLQGINAALVGREFSLKSLVLLYFSL